MRGRTLARLAVAIQALALAGALVVPTSVAAATLGFTLVAPSLSSVNYSDFDTLKGTYTCINDATSNCPTTLQSKSATFSVRLSGGTDFTNVGTVSTSFSFTSSAGGCPTTCSVPFSLTWKAGRAGSIPLDPGVYDLGLTSTISAGQLILPGAITITQESTTTTYTGLTAGMGGTALAMSATVVDADLGQQPGTGIITPDSNLLGSEVDFELFDSTNTTSVAGPVSAFVLSSGLTVAGPSLTLPSAGGTFKLRTTFAGNADYATSADLDTITVTASNTPPVLNLPASPVIAEATSPAGATVTYTVAASDAEDNPAPTPSCAPASGSVFPIGDTTVSCSVTDSGGLTTPGSFTVHVGDTTNPAIGVGTTESDNGHGWYNIASNDGTPGVTVDVTTGDAVGVVSLACTDNGTDVGALSPTGDSFVVGDGTHVVDCTATDGAGNHGSDSRTFKVDQTAPTISAAVSPDAAGTGWWNVSTGAPTVTFTCGDTGSGIASCSAPYTFGEGADQSRIGTATDAAGNTATTSVSGIDVDLVRPSISASMSTDPATSGWWNASTGAPTVTYTCDGGSSAIVSCSAPHQFGEGAGQSDTGSATDAAGNTATTTVSDVNVDLTAPTISASVLPDHAITGWWNASTGAPTVTYTCGDTGSGVATCSDPHQFGEGANQADTGTAVDVAGNAATASVSGIDVDLTAPTISAAMSPAAAGTGWWNTATGAPTATYSCSDAGSGVASCSSPHLFGEGTGQGDTGTVYDLAGNMATTSVSGVNVDLTAPSISASVSPAAAGTGWWNASTGAPTVTYVCSDAGSGLASCPSSHLFGEGAGQGDAGTATDAAGNSASTSVSNVNVDLTAPAAITFVGGALVNGGTYVFGAVPAAPTGCTATDPLSGLASCLVSGYSTAVGPHAVTALAVDLAGNSSSTTLSYTVLPWTLIGFSNPISMTSLNMVKAGATQNLKFQVFAGSSELTTLDAIAAFTQTQISCTTLAPIGPTTNALLGKGAGLKYSTQWQAKWDPPTTANTCWAVSIMTADGSSLTATFQLK